MNKDAYNHRFSLLVQSKLEERGMSVGDLAEMIDLSQSGLYKKLQGTATFTLWDVAQICAALKTSVTIGRDKN